MALREREIYAELRPYSEHKAHCRAVYTGVKCYMHPYMNGQFESLLFQDLVLLEGEGKYVAQYFWMNNNSTFTKLDIKQGDIIDFMAYGEKYKFTESHPLNPMRVPRVIYRLKYPSAVSIIGKCEVPNPIKDLPVVDLNTGVEYSSYCEYAKYSPFTNYSEGFSLGIIQLVDGINWDMIWINRAGQLNCKNCKPTVCFKHVLDEIPEEYKRILVSYNCTPPQPITDVTPATQDTIKHEEEDTDFIGFRFKKS